MNSIEFAINMEHDGIKYYTEQAKINKNNSLNTVFLLLAKDEENHARILQNKCDELSFDLKDNHTLSEVKNVFREMADFKNEIKEIPSQVDLYRTALEKEKQSIDLYNGFLSEAMDEKEKKLFKYLVNQESGHFALLEELILLVNRPDDWIEAAEFGVREEY